MSDNELAGLVMIIGVCVVCTLVAISAYADHLGEQRLDERIVDKERRQDAIQVEQERSEYGFRYNDFLEIKATQEKVCFIEWGDNNEAICDLVECCIDNVPLDPSILCKAKMLL